MRLTAFIIAALAVLFIARTCVRTEPYHQGKFVHAWQHYGENLYLNVSTAVYGGWADSIIAFREISPGDTLFKKFYFIENMRGFVPADSLLPRVKGFPTEERTP